MKKRRKAKRQRSRTRPYAFYLYKSVIVQRPAAAVFRFLVKDLQTHYAQLAKGHEKFEVIGADVITEGAIIACREVAGNQRVEHRYEVKRVVPNRLIHYSSCPSRVFVQTPRRTIEGQSNTFIYYDLAKSGPEKTLLALTIVIQMPSLVMKLLGTITGTKRLWAAHLAEELNALKIEMER